LNQPSKGGIKIVTKKKREGGSSGHFAPAFSFSKVKEKGIKRWPLDKLTP